MTSHEPSRKKYPLQHAPRMKSKSTRISLRVRPRSIFYRSPIDHPPGHRFGFFSSHPIRPEYPPWVRARACSCVLVVCARVNRRLVKRESCESCESKPTTTTIRRGRGRGRASDRTESTGAKIISRSNRSRRARGATLCRTGTGKKPTRV